MILKTGSNFFLISHGAEVFILRVSALIIHNMTHESFDLRLISSFLPRWYSEINTLFPVEHRVVPMCSTVMGSLKALNGSTDCE
jgi:hypothetical protein